MSLTVEQIETEAEKLSDEDQSELLHRLLVGFGQRRLSEDQEIEEAWLEEAKRRSRELRTGQVEAVPADEVFRSVRKLLGRA